MLVQTNSLPQHACSYAKASTKPVLSLYILQQDGHRAAGWRWSIARWVLTAAPIVLYVREAFMSDGFKYNRLSKDDAVVLLVDHQAGLISLVQDYSPGEFKNNVLALADVAKFFNLPTILTTSFEDGPNGPIVPELKETFPDAPYIPRPGQINAWDNEDFVNAITELTLTHILLGKLKIIGRDTDQGFRI
jgi:hypothetical protein